ncbi:hypothetical protein [Methanobrevibacter arboriphilus]|uniref:hypothetical protein n=1 Tax=Methanobrevibacter arboriphilus TaxID=39441 RepID=UPI0024939EA2|nr:hypothetical protein [Methanobrevibacter arboriphilus]
MIYLKNHKDYKTLEYDPQNEELTIHTTKESKPYYIKIVDFNMSLWESFKESKYSKKFLQENIFNNPKYVVLNETIDYKICSPFTKDNCKINEAWIEKDRINSYK